jgi:sialidase-1
MMKHTEVTPLSRRRFLLVTGGLSTAALLARPRHAQAAPSAKIIETKIISQEPQYYHGWPTVARRQNGDLVVVYSGGRDWHICPFGRVDMMVSHDEGKSWSWPRTILDSDLDDRDAGVVETQKGSLLVTTFTSLAYEQIIKQVEVGKPSSILPPERLPAWKAARDRLSPEQRQAQLGVWMVRSTDGGISWSPASRCGVGSPHGPITLKDGRLLYLGKEIYVKGERIGACESIDDGMNWHWLSEIPARKGDDPTASYHELHGVEAADGTIIAHIRNHNKANAGETLQSESSDGGKTWSLPHSIGVWGLPSHLLKLKDGRLLMTYGHRRAPLGNQARVSADNGRTWSEALMISTDGTSWDLGYPSTVELNDGFLLTVWYESMNKGADKAVIRQAQWTLTNG